MNEVNPLSYFQNHKPMVAAQRENSSSLFFTSVVIQTTQIGTDSTQM